MPSRVLRFFLVRFFVFKKLNFFSYFTLVVVIKTHGVLLLLKTLKYHTGTLVARSNPLRELCAAAATIPTIPTTRFYGFEKDDL